MPDEVKKIKFDFDTPAFSALFEIGRLSQNPDLHGITVVGGRLTADQVAENVRRRTEFIRLRATIIKRYNVVPEYLRPLLEKKRRLLDEVEEVQMEIDALK